MTLIHIPDYQIYGSDNVRVRLFRPSHETVLVTSIHVGPMAVRTSKVESTSNGQLRHLAGPSALGFVCNLPLESAQISDYQGHNLFSSRLEIL